MIAGRPNSASPAAGLWRPPFVDVDTCRLYGDHGAPACRAPVQ